MTSQAVVDDCKACSRCGTWKPLSRFARSRRYSTGYLPACYDCINVAKKLAPPCPSAAKAAMYLKRYRESTKGRATRARLVARSRDMLVQYSRRYMMTHKVERAARNQAWKRRYPERDSAHGQIKYRVAKGLIIKPACCSRCGVPGRVEGHHADYAKPLSVAWLCRRCHATIGEPDH